MRSFQTAQHDCTHLTSTVTLVIAFSRWRGGFRKTDSVINRLIRGAVQTGLFTSLFAISDLITFLTLPGTDLYAMFGFPIGRIYTNVSVVDVMNVSYDALTFLSFPFPFGRPSWILFLPVT